MQAIVTAYGMITAILLCFCDRDFVSISSADILSALNHMVDARWNEFGIFLGVDEYTMAAITKDHAKVTDSMLNLVSLWITNQSGTGTRPREWETVVKAVQKTGFDGLAEELAKKYGIDLS